MSPYSYLASTRVEDVCARTGATLLWKPFLLVAVFKATENAGPLSSPAKAAYAIQDLLRWVEHYGLPPLVLPEGFPFRALEVNRMGLVALEEGKMAPFTHAAYRAIFQQGRNLTDRGALAEVAQAAGLDPARALERIDSPEIKDGLRKNTDEAVARGAFGAPTFFVGDELYVGNDRLMFVEQALNKK